jgi:hypothetical protein
MKSGAFPFVHNLSNIYIYIYIYKIVKKMTFICSVEIC